MSRFDVEKRKWDEFAGEYLDRHRDHPEFFRVTETYEEVFQRFNTLRPIFHHLGLHEAAPPGSAAPGPPLALLDLGCGSGWTTKLLAQRASPTVGMDISLRSVQWLAATIEVSGLAGAHGVVGDAERLPFADASFDRIFGHAVIHHLDVDKVLDEVDRLLRPGGRAGFAEPVASNPLINGFRYVKHNWFMRHRGTDHPLTAEDRRRFERRFRRVRYVEAAFTSDRFPRLRAPEAWILRRLPFTRPLATYACILLEK